MIATASVSTQMRYFDLPRYWTRDIVPHLGDKRLNDILVRDVNKYTFGRWRKPFTRGQLPCEFNPSWWDLREGESQSRRGRCPRYWDYTLTGACHWLVNFNLRLASLVRPGSPWRILTDKVHSTVWDGDHTLFEFNYLALGINPNTCFLGAYGGRELPVGKLMRVGFAAHYTEDA